MWWMGLAVAGGYGDAEEGRPSPDERVMMTWVNAARVDPTRWEGSYAAGGCSLADFSEDEKTAKAPLRWSADLGEAARFHSTDMDENEWFDHASSDGTSFFARVVRFYPNPTVGENIFWGPGMSAEDMVLSGWMCSHAGHREAIMSAGYDEAGTGIVGDYATLDFGYGEVGTRAIAVGAHLRAGDTMVLQADAHGDGKPDAVQAVVDGVPVDLVLTAGDAGNGFYRGATDVSGACQAYWFRVDFGGVETRFPENGSYAWGDCDFDDAEAGWLDLQTEIGEEPSQGGGAAGCGCASSPASGAGNAAIGVVIAGVALRQRRRGPRHGMSRSRNMPS